MAAIDVTDEPTVDPIDELPTLDGAQFHLDRVIGAVREVIEKTGHGPIAKIFGVSRGTVTRSLHRDKEQRHGCSLKAEQLIWAILADDSGKILELLNSMVLGMVTAEEKAVAWDQVMDVIGDDFADGLRVRLRKQVVRNRIHRAPMRAKRATPTGI